MPDLFWRNQPSSVKIGTGSAITGCVDVSGGGLVTEREMVQTDDNDFEQDGGRTIKRREDVTLRYTDVDAARDNFTPGSYTASALIITRAGYGGKSGATPLAWTRTIANALCLAINDTTHQSSAAADVVFRAVSGDGSTDPIVDAYA